MEVIQIELSFSPMQYRDALVHLLKHWITHSKGPSKFVEADLQKITEMTEKESKDLLVLLKSIIIGTSMHPGDDTEILGQILVGSPIFEIKSESPFVYRTCIPIAYGLSEIDRAAENIGNTDLRNTWFAGYIYGLANMLMSMFNKHIAVQSDISEEILLRVGGCKGNA